MRCAGHACVGANRIGAGHLILEQIEPGAASPGEFAHRVRRLVDERGIRLIGIDTLNGYINAIPTTDAPITRLHELLSFLNERSIATLISLAQYGTVGSSMAVPIDLSYLADAIVLLRFFEAGGEMRKAISVVKKRTGVHETAIRELKLGPERIPVGQALAEFHGILTGIPQYTGSTKPLLADDRPRSPRLVVDDDASTREVVAAAPERTGARVHLAASAAEAWTRLQHQLSDLIVADLAMPVEDGLTLSDGFGTCPRLPGNYRRSHCRHTRIRVRRMRRLERDFQRSSRNRHDPRRCSSL